MAAVVPVSNEVQSGAQQHSSTRLQEEVDRLRGDIVSCLQQLVRIPSITGSEAEIAEHIAQLLRDMKMQVQVLEAAPGRPNIVATLDMGAPGKTLLLNDHLDIVPPGPLENWTYPPFAAEIVNGRVYGRGTIDTKSGITTILMATRALLNMKWPICGKLVIAFSCDEEVAGDLGIQQLAKWGHLKADYALVAEPTTLQLEIGTKGRLDLEIETRGLATHGARPWLGRNAIYDMMRVVEALRDYAETLHERTHPLLGRASLNVGVIEGGTVGNMVPSVCRIQVDRRVLPQETPEAVMGEIESILQRLRDERPDLQVSMRKRVWWPGYAIGPDDAVVKIFANAFKTVMGRDPIVAGKDAGTDAPFIAGVGTPVVMFSPGNGFGAMNADENVGIDDLIAATKVVAQFIYDVLVTPAKNSRELA